MVPPVPAEVGRAVVGDDAVEAVPRVVRRLPGPLDDLVGPVPPEAALQPGETVTFTLGVANAADRPAVGTVALWRDGTAVAERSVTLDVGEEDTVTLSRRLDATGEYTFTAGDADLTVTVRQDQTPTQPIPDEESPPVMLALAGVGLVLAFGGGADDPDPWKNP